MRARESFRSTKLFGANPPRRATAAHLLRGAADQMSMSECRLPQAQTPPFAITRGFGTPRWQLCEDATRLYRAYKEG